MTVFELLAEDALITFTDNFSLREHQHLLTMSTEPGSVHDLTILEGLSADFIFNFPEFDDSVISREELKRAS